MKIAVKDGVPQFRVAAPTPANSDIAVHVTQKVPDGGKV